jgi:hypothetical protein
MVQFRFSNFQSRRCPLFFFSTKKRGLLTILVVLLCNGIKQSGLSHYLGSFEIDAIKKGPEQQLLLLSQHVLNCNGDSNNNNNLPTHWCMEEDSETPRYYFNNGTEKEEDTEEDLPSAATRRTTIQHYTPAGYEKCLADKTVVMIGDSRVRYQYMHLASTLQSNRFMKCQDYPNRTNNNADPECYLIDHEHHQRMGTNNWIEWYQESSRMLVGEFNPMIHSSSQNSNNSSEGAQEHHQEQHHTVTMSSLCDCFRPSPFRPESTYENRFVKKSTSFGEVNLIFLQNFENVIRMNQQYPPFSPHYVVSSSSSQQQQQRCQTGECHAEAKQDSSTY